MAQRITGYASVSRQNQVTNPKGLMISFLSNMLRRIRVTDSMLIFAVIATGAVLRLWKINEIPFMHDEFSAILRTRFDTFSELIDKGVRIDGHPAGVQVFLYYLIRTFGVSEIVLKLPFILCGTLSIWLIYLIGKDWFNSTVGLVAASFVAFLQFPVMYSQLARPYASGLCFSLAMVYFWTKIIFHPGVKYHQNLAGYIIMSVLSLYNHHFGMLFAAIVALTGLFYCPQKKLGWYAGAGLVVVILYLPHLPILLYQLGVGGVEGWLQKPRYDFIFDYLQYIFQFSVYVYLLIFILISLSLYWHQEGPPVKNKFILISILWFILPYIIGFFYSRYRSSVLQYSVLIFSFPFLLFILFGYLKTSKQLQKLALVALIALVVIPSLIFGRDHYSLFYKGIYSEIVRESKMAVDSLGTERCTVLMDAKKEITPYYLQKWNCENMPFRYFTDLPRDEGVQRWLDGCNADFIAFGCLASNNQTAYAMILEKYPFLVVHHKYFSGDFFLFSRISAQNSKNEYFSLTANNFEPSLPEWGWVDEKSCNDSLALEGKKSWVCKGREFSPTYKKSLRDMIHTENDIIDVSADLRLPHVFPGAWLVITITSDGKSIKWLSVPISDFIKPGETGRVYQSVRMSDVELRHHRLEFSAFVWNPMKSDYILDNFSIRVRSGNPVIYGLYRDIKL